MLFLAAAALLFAGAASAGTIARDSGRPDPVLNSPDEPSCPSADYVGGVDADGNPVVPADTNTTRISPDDIAVERPSRQPGRPSTWINLSGSDAITTENAGCAAGNRPAR